MTRPRRTAAAKTGPAIKRAGRILPALLTLGAASPMSAAASAPLGLFENHADVGAVRRPGDAVFDPAPGTYRVSGGGENMWFKQDAFHFVWRQVSGDVALAADLEWIGTGGNPHRKAGLVIRQSLDPDSPYVDAIVHGNGLVSLQFRGFPGDVTHEVRAIAAAPRRIRLEKQGDTVFMSASEGTGLRTTGGACRIQLRSPFYVGLAVCAHDNSVLEQAVFSRVELTTPAPAAAGEPVLHSTLEIVPVASGDRRVVYHTTDHIEAPNWSRDGRTLLFNSGGRIYRLPATGGVPQVIDTGFATRCNNDHGLSPDGSLLAISDQSQSGKSLIYVVPAGGGAPRQLTALGPSYWHGWSPDGSTLAYCAQRDGKFGIFTIPAAGGEEIRLTTAASLDDGPDYSPDGQSIYFNSDRTGRMQIWRMKPDGSGQTQLTSDEYNNWFAHPSPDGKWIVFLTYAGDVKGHPANKDVMLRLMPADGGEIRVLATLFGGQGTINVPSWSPDSTELAFVSYLLIRQ